MRESSKTRRVAVVIPVYCERETVPTLVREIFEQPVDADLQVWVVDDNSPDGTATAVEELRPLLPGLQLISRDLPEGRGAAVLDAFGRLLAADDPPDLIVEMDGDGSHEATSLTALIEAAEGADVVIGSRYVDGGGADLSFRRRLLSRMANGFSRIILGLPFDDCSTGYRCYRGATLAGIDLGSFRCGGHATHLELLFRLHRGGVNIVEVPIQYRARCGGDSKVTLRETLRVARVLLRMRLTAESPRHAQMTEKAPGR